jgi:hypothetical protein
MIKCDHSEKCPENKFTNAPHCYIVCGLHLYCSNLHLHLRMNEHEMCCMDSTPNDVMTTLASQDCCSDIRVSLHGLDSKAIPRQTHLKSE